MSPPVFFLMLGAIYAAPHAPRPLAWAVNVICFFCAVVSFFLKVLLA